MIQFELETDRSLFEDAMTFAQKQVRSLVDRNPDFYPMYTEGGRLEARQTRVDALVRRLSARHDVAVPAQPRCRIPRGRLVDGPRHPLHEAAGDRKTDREVHDLGFIFLPTYLRWYQITHQTGR